jgi:hypothetical protein
MLESSIWKVGIIAPFYVLVANSLYMGTKSIQPYGKALFDAFSKIWGSNRPISILSGLFHLFTSIQGRGKPWAAKFLLL